MHIERIANKNDSELRDLLLLADEQWDCVERYLNRAQVFGLYERDTLGESGGGGRALGSAPNGNGLKAALRAECCLTDEGNGVAELQNLAVTPDCQRRGYGRALVAYALRRCRGRFHTLRVRTGDSPLTVPFYRSCGFAQVGRIEGDILARYDHPIFEAGVQLEDTVVLEQPVPASRPATRVFTADLHLGDRAIARWRGFGEDVDAHDALVLSRLEEALLPNDELWILGDVCKPRVEDVRHVRAAIPCDHVSVIVGNHDARSKFVTAGGFETVEYYAHVGKVRREGYRFVLCHYPMLDWDRAYHGSYMLHGHIHSLDDRSPAPDSSQGGMGMRGYNSTMRDQGIRRYDVGLDANGMRPVTAEQIVAALPSDEEWAALHGLPVD